MSIVHAVAERSVVPPGDMLGDPVWAAQHIYRALLRAIAAPGSVHQLVVHPAVAKAGPIGNPWLASALLTLLDHEVSLAVETAREGDALVDLLHRRTRTPRVSVDQADFVVAELVTLAPSSLERLKRGSLQYPDDAATLFLRVASLAPTDAAGGTLTVRGPGVDGQHEVVVPGVSDAFLASREHTIRNYPMGIDLYLIDDAGRVIAIPRTAALSRGRQGGG